VGGGWTGLRWVGLDWVGETRKNPKLVRVYGEVPHIGCSSTFSRQGGKTRQQEEEEGEHKVQSSWWIKGVLNGGKPRSRHTLKFQFWRN